MHGKTKTLYAFAVLILLMLSLSNFTDLPVLTGHTTESIEMHITKETLTAKTPPIWVRQMKTGIKGLVIDFDFPEEKSQVSGGYFKVVIEEIPVIEIFIELTAEIENVSVTVKKLDEKPEYASNISRTILKLGYTYLEITSDAPADKIKQANITFRVENAWMKKNNITRAEIKLLRWHEGKWTEIDTTPVSYDEKYTYYSATSPGLSAFAIIAKQFEAGYIKCNSFEKKCFGDDLKECSTHGTSWVFIESCEFGCLNGRCMEKQVRGAEEFAITSIWLIIVIFILFALILYVLIRMRD